MHGNIDEIVPFSMGEKLFAAAGEPKYFYPVEGAGHNDTYLVGGQKYMDIIGEFVRDSKLGTL